MSARVAGLVLLLVAAARPLPAQLLRTLGVDAQVSRVRYGAAAPGGGELLSGLLFGGRARLALGPVSLEASYAQGRLSADTGGAPARDLVEGRLAVVGRPAPWLVLEAGPHLRAYTAPGGTERWVMWEVRAFGEAPIIGDVLRARAGGWAALASSVNADPGASGGRGAQVALAVRPSRSPLVFRLAYTVEQAAMRDGVRTETLETVALGIGLGGR